MLAIYPVQEMYIWGSKDPEVRTQISSTLISGNIECWL